MSKELGIALAKLRTGFTRLPYPPMFSRIVSVLLTYVDRDRLHAWPSQKRLATQVGCNERTVKRNLEAARNLGLLTIESVSAQELQQRVPAKKKLTAHHRYTIYTVNLEHPLWKGDEDAVTVAKQTIKASTHQGVDRRCDRRAAVRNVEELVQL